MLFEKIVGQQALKQELIQLQQKDKIPHALLFLAKAGTGGLPLALAFVQYLFCEQKTAEDACGTCPSCIQVQKLEHPDLHFSFPTVPSKPGEKNLSEHYLSDFKDFCKSMPYGSSFDWLQYIQAENKKGNISADETRQIIQSLSLKSYQGGYKIHILWRPEYLGKEGNVLLKLIEEPPAKTLLILVAEERDQILPTILSRLQVFQLKPLSIETIQATLSKDFAVEPKLAGQIALASEGNFNLALQLKDNWHNDSLPIITQWLNAVYSNNGLAILDWVDAQAALGIEALRNLFQYTQQLFAVAMRCSITKQEPTHLTAEDAQFVKKLIAIKLDIKSYQTIHQAITAFVYQISRNTHLKSSLLKLSIQMQYWIKNNKIEQLA